MCLSKPLFSKLLFQLVENVINNIITPAGGPSGMYVFLLSSHLAQSILPESMHTLKTRVSVGKQCSTHLENELGDFYLHRPFRTNTLWFLVLEWKASVLLLWGSLPFFQFMFCYGLHSNRKAKPDQEGS